MSEETLFHEALAKSPVEWPAFLDAACAGQPELRAAVEGLLAAHAASGGLFDKPAIDPNATGAYEPASVTETGLERPGTRIGPYKLLQKIGEGGMGTVWMAEQTTPVRRHVALKIIKPGLSSAQVVARFEAERQALALMDHPHIAKVLDGGATPDGRPFFVMELVKGVPLTKYCDEHRLTPKQRLELFIPVCHAIQHAHQKGIIHRDIKPSNVLVAPYDGRPVPKVIDFGIAKATGPQLTEKTLFTEFGAVVGTLEYMSPEQAELNNQDIDTRSDIYSLGVLLYELLTGTTPLDRSRLKSAAFNEILRLIREEDPPTPSHRLSSSESLPTISAQRQMEPRQLGKLLRGDLDWIVMKALAKERDRRYETANGLALDIQRHLADEPVLAGPPSTAYRLQKFVRRHQGRVLATAAILLLLVAGITGTTTGLVWALNAMTAAQQNERTAQVAQRAEQQAREAEAAQRRQAEAVADLLESTFRGLNPQYTGLDFKEALTQRLQDVAAKLDRDYAGEPLVRARLRFILGVTHHHLGDFDRAITLIRQAAEEHESLLGPNHLQTLTCLNNLGAAYQYVGQLSQAERVQEDVLARVRLHHGADQAAVSRSMTFLARLYEVCGHAEKAVPLFEKAWALHQEQRGPDHQDSLVMMSNLGLAQLHAGRTAQGLELLERATARLQAVLGPSHPATLSARNNLATGYYDAGHHDKAVAQAEQVLQRHAERHGTQHPQVLLAKNNLAVAYKEAGRLEDALKLLEEVVQGRQARLGLEHPDTLIGLNNLADAGCTPARPPRRFPFWKTCGPSKSGWWGQTIPPHCSL
jgi:serine/threonine protein kinase/tetratricopeptide (TPR) repeat protein